MAAECRDYLHRGISNHTARYSTGMHRSGLPALPRAYPNRGGVAGDWRHRNRHLLAARYERAREIASVPIQTGDARFGVSAGCTYRDRSGTRGSSAMISREPIYAALFALAAGAAHFVTTGRKLRHWSDLTAPEQPALFMRQKLEIATVAAIGAPTVWKLVV